MRCKKCGKERSAGKAYDFYYGNSQTYGSYWDLGRVITTHSWVHGKNVAWICRVCIKKTVILYFILSFIGPIMIIVPFLVRISPIGLALSIPIIGIIYTVLVSRYTFFKLVRGVDEIGSLVAINANKSDLEKKGYNAFWTPYEYS